ncbi:MAG: hypothetical protein QQN63_04650 [Nitrosopumilus sp.]
MNNPVTANAGNSQSAFFRRLEELENAVELSEAVANQAELLERRFLGPGDGDQNQGGPAHVPTSLNDALEVHAINLKLALERASCSLERLASETGGVPTGAETPPVEDDPYLKPLTYGSVPK